MKARSFCIFLFIFSVFLPAWTLGFEDCFNYQCVREDNKDYQLGWEMLKAFESNKDNFILEKRWPTVNLKLTPAEERARFGTTGLEVAKKAYLAQHFDGTNMRMLVYMKVVRAAGERKVIGWRPELNPPMPREYLNPNFPEKDKKGLDWSMMIHWVHPPDIRGTGVLVHSYNFYRALLQPRECWVIRAVSVRGGYCDYYHTRIWTVDKEWGYGPIIEEMYNKKGSMISTHSWFWARISTYDGKVIGRWTDLAEDINFEERGFSFWTAHQTNFGYENPDAWFTLRELKRSIPTVNIPYMAVLPPKEVLPIDDILPSEELQKAYRKHFPVRTTSLPNAERPIGIEAW